MKQFVSIASGTTASAPFLVERGGFSMMVPSLGAPAAVFIQFAQSSGGTFFDLTRSDGSGNLFAVTSGGAPSVGYLPSPPTPWARLRVSVPVTEPCSVAVVYRG